MESRYKFGISRELAVASGIAGEIVFATLKPNDLEFVRDMIKRTPSLKERDILINNRYLHFYV